MNLFAIITNATIRFIHHLSLLLGLTALCSWIYFNLTSTPESSCLKLTQNPLLLLGLLLLLTFLLRLLTLCLPFPCNKDPVLHIFSIAMIVLVVAIFAKTRLAYMRLESKLTILKVEVFDYSIELQRQIVDWHETTECLARSGICTTPQSKWTSLQQACCRPSMLCNFKYKKPNIWGPETELPQFRAGWVEGPALLLPHNCSQWSNDQRVLCYNCEVCRQRAIYHNLSEQWKQLAEINIYITICVLLYSIIRFII